LEEYGIILQCDGKHSNGSRVAKSRLQQVKRSPNAAATNTNKGKKESAYPWKASDMQGSPARSPHLHCQPLNEGWGGSRLHPFNQSGSLHAPELPWAGPAFPPGAPSLLQALTQHFHYTP